MNFGPTDPDASLARAIGLDRTPRGTYLRYVWRLTASHGWLIGEHARVMAAGFEVSDDPAVWRPCSSRCRAAVGISSGAVVAADVEADPAVGRIASVRWCHLSPFGLPPYGSQLDGQSLNLLFWTAENCGVSVEVAFGSIVRRRSILAIRKAAAELAEQVARTSADAEFRNMVASCFPGAGGSWDSPPPDPEKLRDYVARVRGRLAELLADSEHETERRAFDLWYAGVDDTTFAELLPDYPPELAARVLPHLRRIREDEEM